MIVLAAVALGLLAFTADSIGGTTGRIMIAVVSSGLAWGSAALLAGRTAQDRRSAVTDATVLLASATVVYYLLILVISRRWSGGVLVDGSSADGYGLRSVAVMTTAWLLVSMVAGPSLGLVGQLTRAARLPSAALAAGAACGLLSGQGWQEITAAPPWGPGATDGPAAAFVHGIGAAHLIEVIVPLVVLAWLATAQRLWRAWPVMLIVTAVTATLSALVWHLLRTAAHQLG
jgi:hypothetical protein